MQPPQQEQTPLERLLADMPSLKPYAETLKDASPDLLEELAASVRPRACKACGVSTPELYSRTVNGAQYCLACMKRGAGLDELLKSALLSGMVSTDEIAKAKANGFIT
jgi:hypothetical protein